MDNYFFQPSNPSRYKPWTAHGGQDWAEPAANTTPLSNGVGENAQSPGLDLCFSHLTVILYWRTHTNVILLRDALRDVPQSRWGQCSSCSHTAGLKIALQMWVSLPWCSVSGQVFLSQHIHPGSIEIISISFEGPAIPSCRGTHLIFAHLSSSSPCRTRGNVADGLRVILSL